MRALAVPFFVLAIAYPAAAQNTFTSDAQSCDLNQRTRLSDLCPNGFGLPTYGTTQEIMTRNPNNAGMIVQAANEYGVDPRLALSVSAHEGAMSACAGSFSGVRGPMQLTSGTAKGYGMDRNILSENIRGGMATLKDAIKSCGGDKDIRCLADRYNGSTEQQRRNWTNDVTRRLASMQNTAIPQGCNGTTAACMGPGDFPRTNTDPTKVAGNEPGVGSSLATIVPSAQPTDIVVPSGLALWTSPDAVSGNG